MGYGDEIMTSGEAKKLFQQYGKPVLVTGVGNAPRYSDIWDGLDYIVNPCEFEGDISKDVIVLKNGPRARPYIANANTWTKETGIKFTHWRVRDCVGEIKLTPHEESFAYNNVPFDKPFVVIEPTTSKHGSPNKRWPFEKWQDVVRQLHNDGTITFVQVGEGDESRKLKGVHFIKCPTFRHAAAIMKRAKAAILPEGGLHHVAGVFRIPAVVLFGGFISPMTTGYPWHVNIAADNVSASPCGKWMECEHCKQIWARLEPSKVIRKFKLLNGGFLP